MAQAQARSNRGGKPEAQRERAVATRAALLSAARDLFAQAGYHATGTPEIAARAQMTRGALYHHFAGKEELFAEVFRMVAEELVLRSNAAAASLKGDLWPQVSEAFRQYLELVAASAEYQRILLIDGPAVLGWARWREVQSEFVASGTARALEMMMDQGMLARQPAQPLANLIQAALNDAAMAIANSDRPEETSREASEAFQTLLSGLRVQRRAT